MQPKPAKNSLICEFFIKARRDSPRRTLQYGDLYQSIDLDELYQTNTILISKFISIHLKIPKNLRKIKRNVKGFAWTHSPMWRPISIDRSRRALSNQHHFNIKVHFHPLENPKTTQKKMRKMKRNFVKRERIRPDALSNVETYIN